MSSGDRIANEIAHGRKISENAESIWGWASATGKQRAARRADYFVCLGKFSTGLELLELGCGTGIFTERVFKATGALITAIDISEELLEQAKKKLPQANFQIQDAMHTSFAANRFDGVYGSSVLHHLDMTLALKEVYRVVKPGGWIVFAEPNMLNPQILIERYVPIVKKYLGISPDETAVVRWKMKSLLQNTGFSECRVFPYDYLHPLTPSFLIGVVEKAGRVFERIPILKEIAGSVIISARKPY